MKEVYDTNLLGTTLACQAFLNKNLRQRLKGSIINIASSAATRSGPGMVTYAASKAGVLGLTRSLGSEYSRSGFRVNVISPGFIDTEMTQGRDQLTKNTSLITKLLVPSKCKLIWPKYHAAVSVLSKK